jgi:TrpR-related protein YerC/YecD
MTSGKVTSAEANPETAARFDELVGAFAALRDKAVTAAFLRDICTTTEIDAMGQRLQVARLVNEGISYQEISRRTGASTATVTRVAQWLHHGEGGYAAVLKRGRR